MDTDTDSIPDRDRQALDADPASNPGKMMSIQPDPDPQHWLYSTEGISTCLRVVEIAEHLVSLNACLVHGAEAGL
jgi:hypothetical protein